MTTSTTSRWNPNFRTRLVTTGLTLFTPFFVAIPAATAAEPVRIGQDVWSAYDSDNMEHVITVLRQDREGDFLIAVREEGAGYSTEYWIDCKQDIIAEARAGARWNAIDHRKMEGWYSDVACRLN